MTLFFFCYAAQAISCRSLAVGTRVQFQTSPCGICGGKSGIWKGFPCHDYSTTAAYSFTYHGSKGKVHPITGHQGPRGGVYV
jgi:hypothetical protein